MGLTTAIAMCVSLVLGSPRQAIPPARHIAAREHATRVEGVQQAALGPFSAARFVPADTRMLIRVERAARLRRDLATRPIAGAITSLLADGAVLQSWRDLSRSLGMDESQLFDKCFGREFTFVSRAEGEWVVISNLGADLGRSMLRLLQVRAREPRFGFAVSELPEQDALLASEGDHVIIGPSGQSGLFFEVLERWNSSEIAQPVAAHGASLSHDPEFAERLAELDCQGSRAAIAAFIRHDRPLGGCSLVVADLRGDEVSIRQSARFANPLFASPITKMECDFSPVSAFADRSLVAIMQPRDVGDGPVDAYLAAGLGTGLISPEMRNNLADRRMLVVGEADGRQMPDARDILTTTFVACLELKDAVIAPEQLDRQMAAITTQLNRLGDGAFVIRIPDVGTLRANQARQADLGAAAEWFTGGFPVMKTVSLNWAVADTTQGKWFVVGSHPQALQDAIGSLSVQIDHDHRVIGRFDSVGVANGLRLGRHVQSWSDAAPEFTDAENVESVRSTLRTFADLASGLTDCRWQMARPTPTTLRLEVQARLAPAETIRP